MNTMRLACAVARKLVWSILPMVLASGGLAWGQAAQPAAPAAPASAGPFRKLAPGVENTIPADVAPADNLSVHDLHELLTLDPTFGEQLRQYQQKQNGDPEKAPVVSAKQVRIPHASNWGLDFTFKPLRFIRAGVPDRTGAVTSELVWYLIYHVKNTGENPVRFIPVFWLTAEGTRVHTDKLMPSVVPLIERREDPNRHLLNTVEIEGELAPMQEVWGVVTWDGIDPATDRFSIYVQGLSGAYQWIEEAPPAAGAPPGSGRKIKLKTLQLNFWRPGDAFYEHESEIRYGAPGEVDHQWIYR
jgi:hypothetical protein